MFRLVLIPAPEERTNFTEEDFALLVPLWAPRRMSELSRKPTKRISSAPDARRSASSDRKHLEKRELKAISGFHRGAHQRNRYWRRKRFEFLGNPLAADLDQHPAHPLIKIIELQQLQRTFRFQIFHDAAADVRHKRKVLVVGSARGTVQSVIQPLGIVVDHLIAADLKGGAIANEGDHGEKFLGRIRKSRVWGERGGWIQSLKRRR